MNAHGKGADINLGTLAGKYNAGLDAVLAAYKGARIDYRLEGEGKLQMLGLSVVLDQVDDRARQSLDRSNSIGPPIWPYSYRVAERLQQLTEARLRDRWR